MKQLSTLTILTLFLQAVFAQVVPTSVLVYKKDTAFTCITVDSITGNVYAGTNGRGIWKFDQKVWKNWSGINAAFTRSNLRQIAVSGNDVWVASSGYVVYLGSADAGNNNNYWGGMHKIDQALPNKRIYYRGRPVLGQQSLTAQGPPTRNILGVCIDNTGKPWCAGSYHDSITYPAFLNYNARYHFAPGAVGMFNGTNFDFLTGVDLPDPTGILIGVGNNYKDENYSIGKRRTCRSIVQAGNEIWVGSDGYEKDAATIITAGILRYSLSGAYIGKYDQNNTPVPFGLTNGDFGPWALYKDAQSRVWTAMPGNKGIAVFDNSGWHYIGIPSVLASTTLVRANAITGNSNGEVFFGTSNGLLVYKGAGAYTDAASYTVYTTVQGLSSNSILGVAIGKDQSIWAATALGVNKILRGDLFVYNRRPNRVIFTDQDALRTPVMQYDSKKTQQLIDKDTLLISADGGRGAIFKWAGSAAQNVKFRFAEDPNGLNPDEFGSFSVRHQNADSIRVLFTHPKFVDEIYTVTNDGGRTVRLQVVDTTVSPATVLINIPVRFVLPPVLMIHGVWSSVKSFEKMQAALLSSFRNYRDYSLLRTWYSDDVHPEPVASQAAYQYVVPSAITELVENCAIHKMAVGKVDILAHSRGGIFSRLYLQENFVNYRNDINKLITINTPHSGSQQANLSLDKRILPVIKTIKIAGLPIGTYGDTTTLGRLFQFFSLQPQDDINGAFELKVNSPAIVSTLNGSTNLNRNTTYSHAIIGRQLFGTTTFASVMSSGLLRGNFNFSIRLMAGLTGSTIALVDDKLKEIFNGDFNDIVVGDSSQKGGLSEANVSRFPGLNIAHSTKEIGPLQVATGVLEIPQVWNRVATLLRAKSTGSLFTTDGFHPPVLTYNFLQPNPPFLTGTAERMTGTNQDSFYIVIDTALNGKAFTAGDTVTVRVSKRSTDTLLLSYTGRTTDTYSDEHFGNDTVFRFPIPRTAIGTINIQAYGFRNHQLAFDSVAIRVGVPTGITLDSIKIQGADASGLLTVTQGDSLYIGLNGYYSDGVVRDITYQTPLTYSVLGTYISATLPNKVKGLAVGIDELTIRYQGKADSVNVEVIPPFILPPTLPLPVTFMGITAKYTGNKVSVSWNTLLEINNDRFEVEHSITGNNFTAIGTVAAKNNNNGSSYIYYDLNYAAGKNYYRIKQVDKDGKTSYSNTVLVTVDAEKQITIYPNPASGQVTISTGNIRSGVKVLRIMNMAGQKVYEQPLGNGSITVNVSGWAAGIYSIELFSGDKKRVYTETFLKK